MKKISSELKESFSFAKKRLLDLHKANLDKKNKQQSTKTIDNSISKQKPHLNRI